MARPGKDHREPLLKALHAATAGLDGATQSNLVVVFSGTDRQDEAFIAALGEKASVQNPKLRLPGNTTLLLAQVAPEPGSDLDLLSRAPIAAGAVEALPFDDNLGTVMARRVLKVLRPEEDKPLEDAEIAEVCTLAFKYHTPCILPFEPSTGTPLPRPPLRGQGGDWYATVAWVVVDGLILTDAPSGAPPPSD